MYKNRRKQEEKHTHTHTTDSILSNDKMDFSIRDTCKLQRRQFVHMRADADIHTKQ